MTVARPPCFSISQLTEICHFDTIKIRKILKKFKVETWKGFDSNGYPTQCWEANGCYKHLILNRSLYDNTSHRIPKKPAEQIAEKSIKKAMKGIKND